jgi:hypothetical protein
MNSPLIHGCYDSKTLDTLRSIGVKEFSFDLRGRSTNLVTFKALLSILEKLTTEKIFLTFQDDRKEIISSFLNLLQDRPFTYTLVFRDHKEPEFYRDLGRPFYWFWNPEGDWKSILTLPNLQGIILPIKYQTHYQSLAPLWNLIDEHQLDVYLHAENFEEALFLRIDSDIKFSLDLTSEVETSYRSIDQDKLKGMKIWRKLDENSAR